jgi:hypothetical protein
VRQYSSSQELSDAQCLRRVERLQHGVRRGRLDGPVQSNDGVPDLDLDHARGRTIVRRNVWLYRPPLRRVSSQPRGRLIDLAYRHRNQALPPHGFGLRRLMGANPLAYQVRVEPMCHRYRGHRCAWGQALLNDTPLVLGIKVPATVAGDRQRFDP